MTAEVFLNMQVNIKRNIRVNIPLYFWCSNEFIGMPVTVRHGILSVFNMQFDTTSANPC